MIRFKCPYCGKSLKAKSEWAGKTVICTGCRFSFPAPQSSLPPTPKPLRDWLEPVESGAVAQAGHPSDEQDRLQPHGSHQHPHLSVRKLSWTLQFIRLRQSIRAVLDQLRLGAVPGARLAAALILGVVFFFAVLVVGIVAKFTTTTALLLASGSFVAAFIPMIILVTGSSDDRLEADRTQTEDDLAGARLMEARHRASRQVAMARGAQSRPKVEESVGMALVPCPECNKRISRTAQSCPNCGYDLKAAKKKIEQAKASKQAGIGCLVLLAIAVVCGLVTSNRDSSSSGDRPRTGEAGVLRTPGGGNVTLAVSRQAHDRMLHLANGKDAAGIGLMLMDGSLFNVPNGTKCHVIESGSLTYEVRIMEGEHLGQSGIVTSEWVQKP